MKLTIEQIVQGEEEVILRYREFTSHVERIVNVIKGEECKILGSYNGCKVIVDKHEILYIESVDGKTFAYTKEAVYQMDYTLLQLTKMLQDINFFRCSKSMILNIDKVASLKSLSSNRIDAAMCNGEHIVISRTYAVAFRKRLRGE